MNLSEKIKHSLNSLTIAEIDGEISYPFEHEIIWYGIDAVSHVYLMRRAREMSAEDFVKRYIFRLNLNLSPRGVPVCLSKKIEGEDLGTNLLVW